MKIPCREAPPVGAELHYFYIRAFRRKTMGKIIAIYHSQQYGNTINKIWGQVLQYWKRI
ncbi:MAG TPA: hypothetical protein VK568_10730 [Thermodesulfobacteriota bacterium]|nr:hypothetical protein [Thermodesulfobacteriota bacterium]